MLNRFERNVNKQLLVDVGWLNKALMLVGLIKLFGSQH